MLVIRTVNGKSETKEISNSAYAVYYVNGWRRFSGQAVVQEKPAEVKTMQEEPEEQPKISRRKRRRG